MPVGNRGGRLSGIVSPALELLEQTIPGLRSRPIFSSLSGPARNYVRSRGSSGIVSGAALFESRILSRKWREIPWARGAGKTRPNRACNRSCLIELLTHDRRPMIHQIRCRNELLFFLLSKSKVVSLRIVLSSFCTRLYDTLLKV